MDSSTLKRCAGAVCIVLALCVGVTLTHAGNFAGVGLQVVPIATGELVVLRVVEGGPASAADIRPGDLILRVGDFSLAGSDFTEVVTEHLWGAPDTSIVLDYMRPGESGARSATVRRVLMEPKTIETPGVRTLTPP